MIKRQYSAFLCLFSIFTVAQHTDIINSNRPGESMSAYAIGKNVFQIEAATYYLNQNNSNSNFKNQGLGTDAILRFGVLLEKAELSLQTQYEFKNIDDNQDLLGFKKLTFGLKYLLYDPYKYEKEVNIRSWKANHDLNFRDLIPAVSLFLGTNFISPLNSYEYFQKGVLSPKIMLITQHQFYEGRTVLVTNTIVDYLTINRDSGFIVTLTRGFNKSWSGFLEYQNFNSNPYNKNIFRTGTAYLLNKNMQIDMALTKNLEPNINVFNACIGFSWRTDANHKGQRIKIKKPINDKQQKEKAKKKEEKEDIQKLKIIQNNTSK